MLADQVWDEKGWTEETMEQFLNTHMRTPYKKVKQPEPNAFDPKIFSVAVDRN